MPLRARFLVTRLANSGRLRLAKEGQSCVQFRTERGISLYSYKGVISRQLPDGPEIVMFSAPSTEIAKWAGIPQRRRIEAVGDSIETAGFQRESKESRVHEIARFMTNAQNVIQNPLLTAVQNDGAVKILRHPDGTCDLSIEDVDFRALTLLELFDRVREILATRLPGLNDRVADPTIVQKLREELAEQSDTHVTDEGSDTDRENDIQQQEETSVAGVIDESDNPDLTTGLFQEETQVVDFYDELNARAAILREMGEPGDSLSELGGFPRSYLEDLLRPVVLVDGQHRLLGATEAVDVQLESEAVKEAIKRYVDEGMDPREATDKLIGELARRLPISLLASASPAEHVFQFVVVNQKATQMSDALLGTIVSTSLTREELEGIASRLTDAGIKLDSSRAVAFLSRAPESPFAGLVRTGVGGDRPKSLPWSVLLKLANMVRLLEGEKSFHSPALDYPKIWAKNYFDKTGLVPTDLEPEERIRLWRKDDGPWRELFIRLHRKIRDTFGDVSDRSAKNAWGSTESNIFNLISLSILTQDFFAFLRETDCALESWEAVDRALSSWLEGLNTSYFNRDWRMAGTKKDQAIIKQAWSSTWFGYRLERDSLPRVEKFNPGGRKG
jgi:hypothetical protein